MATNLHPAEERARIALNLVANIYRLSDHDIAERVNLSRSQVEARRNGRTKIKLGEIDMFADELNVPAALWTGPAADLLQWFADRARAEGTQDTTSGTCKTASHTLAA